MAIFLVKATCAGKTIRYRIPAESWTAAKHMGEVMAKQHFIYTKGLGMLQVKVERTLKERR